MKHLKKSLQFLFKYRIHFIAWLSFSFYEILLAGILRGYFASAGSYFTFYTLNILLFYAHAHVTLPLASRNKRYSVWLIPLFILLEVLIYVTVNIGVISLLQKYWGLSLFTPVTFNKMSVINVIWRMVYFLLFSTGYYYLINFIKERKTLQSSEREKLMVIIENQNIQADLVKSQHAYLKAQINPHFLFNTLSYIYSSTRKAAPEAADAIMSLSEMMRYALREESEYELTPIKIELEQVENLIRLHQIKSQNRLNMIFKCDDEVKDLAIIPFVIMTLVENVFKHGDLFREDNPALISLCTDGRTLVIETENLIYTKNTRKSHHIGLDNTKKRLHMVYGHKATLDYYTAEDNYFNVSLRIEID